MRNHLVVVGAGLAGLAAAATAARAGAEVTILDTRSPGGRARTDTKEGGYRLNQGPHALYKGGPGWRVLAGLGVHPKGHQPPIRGTRAFIGGDANHRLLTGRTTALITRLVTIDPSRWAGRSTRELIDGLGRSREAALFTEALVRVTTYVDDMDRMPADLALAQIRSGLLRGVMYVDGGWATLVDGLAEAAARAGAVVRAGVPVHQITCEPGGWEVVTGSGELLRAAAVVIASGGPAAARSLLPVDVDWGELGPEVTAACLDLGLRGRPPRFALGIDEPLYFSPHCPPGDLAPAGHSVVHVMRYGARNAKVDRDELRGFAAQAGVRDENVVIDRFLANMTVTHVLPSPERGLAGRPAVAVAEADGLFLAGDWVGPVGWLADAALASGAEAGARAAEVVSRRRPRSRVA